MGTRRGNARRQLYPSACRALRSIVRRDTERKKGNSRSLRTAIGRGIVQTFRLYFQRTENHKRHNMDDRRLSVPCGRTYYYSDTRRRREQRRLRTLLLPDSALYGDIRRNNSYRLFLDRFSFKTERQRIYRALSTRRGNFL